MMRLRELQATSPLLDKAKSLVSSVDALPEAPERLARLRRELDRPRARLAFARRLPAWGAASVLLLFGASAFAALRLFGLAGSQPARDDAPPPMAANVAERSPAPTPAPQLDDATAQPDPVAPPHPGRAAKPARLRAGHGHKQFARVSARHATARRSPKPTLQLAAAPSQALVDPEQSALLPLSPAVAQSTEPSVEPSPASSPAAMDESQSNAAAQSTTAAQPMAAAQASPVAPAARDSELVHRALKALRRDHDPALAASLLDQQRARYGDGPLAEEALALQIEASALLKQVRSHELAREYLARYPNGRYRSIVQRALQESAP